LISQLGNVLVNLRFLFCGLASLTSVSAFKEDCLVFADVFVDVPDELDISSMRGQGLQPDEQLLPETAGVFLSSLNLLLNCGQLPELHMALASEVT
jgi:hypothetical protein